MKSIYAVNPSRRLLAAGKVTDSGSTRTCMSDTCSCASHDSGYSWANIELPDDVEIHVYPGNVHCHKSTCLMQEYVEHHTAQGLPANAPEWAYTLNSRWDMGDHHFGQKVEVKTDGDYTVVFLIEGVKRSLVERQLFATKDGKNDHTKQYRSERFLRFKKERTQQFLSAGLTKDEAERLFSIGKEQWMRELERHLFANASQFRVGLGGLIDLAQAYSSRDQLLSLRTLGIDLKISFPRTQAFGMAALFVFHNIKEVVPSLKPTTEPVQTGLCNLGSILDSVLS
ncbi:MAG: hypothetical protein V4576_00025 [Patescibacteria group bacterium]